MKKNIPLHVNILTIFTIVICVIVLSVVSYGYSRNSDTALLAAEKLLEKIGSSIAERTQKIFDTAFMTLESCINFDAIGEKASIHSHPMSPVFFKVLKQNPDFTSIYIGFADGDFYLISSLRGREEMKKSRGIPDSAVWYTQTIGHKADGRRYQLTRYLNAGYITVGSSSSLDVDYDPRKRGWFQTSISTDSANISDIYIFAMSGEPGITISRRFDAATPGVVGVDLSLSNMSRFVKGQLVDDSSEIMMFDIDGNIYAYPDIKRLAKAISVSGGDSTQMSQVDRLQSPVLSELQKNYQTECAGQQHGCRLSVDDTSYLANVYPLPKEYGKELFVGITVPEKFFTGPIAHIGQQTMLVSLGILIFSLPVVYYVARRISRPLNRLTQAVERIKSFELDTPVNVSSHIDETRQLSKAMETMRETLLAFSSYIPKPLVQAMVVKHISPTIGGDRRKITFFFSDIQDFTAITENLSPEEVTGSITRYLKRMGAVILQNEGTIDKYIGDSVMAFWNAPVEIKDHARLACLSALQCREKLGEFNNQCTLECDPVFLTRMGIHTGEAVVGNIGSSDRMNYTAMGASVNFASRLEGLNKYLGTEILVSETTRKDAGDEFLFRFAGIVKPKGISVAMRVYELLGTRHGSIGEYAPHGVSSEREDHVRNWETAVETFLSRDFKGAAASFTAYLETHGSDALVEHYLSVAKEYMVSPPGPDWHGEQTFKAK